MNATFPGYTPGLRAEPARSRHLSLRREAAIAGTLAACLGLAGGRWGSYLGKSPVYLTDVLVASACIGFLWSRERDTSAATKVAKAPTGILVAFAMWTLVRFVVGGRFDLVALRDAVPYGYAVMGVVSGAAIVQSTAFARARTARLLTWALGAHAAWFFVVVALWKGLPNHLPTLSATEGVHVLTPRGDFDTAMVGVYAAFLIATGFRRSWAWWRLAAIAMCVTAIGLSPSRAGLIGAAAAVVCVVVSAARDIEVPYQVRMGLAGTAVVLLAALALVFPFTVPGQRALATVGLMSTPQGTRAVGTAHARENAWGTALRYTLAEPSRIVDGVGFGRDYMRDSGAIYRLTSNDNTRTRAPHSWWVDVTARLGIVGLALSAMLVLRTLRRVRLVPSLAGEDNDRLLVLASLVVLALLAPMSFGVILESPFGALPFYWCAGIVLSFGVLAHSDETETLGEC